MVCYDLGCYGIIDWVKTNGKNGRGAISEEFLQEFRSNVIVVDTERVYKFEDI